MKPDDVKSTLVVFGGASGIGLAVARIAIAQGAAVLIADTDEKMRERDLVRGGACSFVRCDATDPQQVQAALDQGLRFTGRLDGVVTTVGGAHLHDPLEVDLAAWRRETALNLDSAYLVATSAARIMAATGGGSIVTTSSSFANVARADRIAYAASKAGVISLTKSLALAVARKDIRVNCISPGATDTPRVRAMTGSDADWRQICEQSVQGRIQTTDDVANAIVFLLSPGARSITGQVIWVNNGSYMP
ncbi:MAG: SDR family oxidoreductase [Burkholderiaceae bacterium]|nr:SDR family oxidoreductase [Burkholderiaceae bacterium]